MAYEETQQANEKVDGPGQFVFCLSCDWKASLDATDLTAVEACPNCGGEVHARLTETGLINRYGPEVFTFERGSFFGGMRRYSIRCLGEVCWVSVCGMNGDFVDESNTASKSLVIEKVVKPIVSLDWKEDYKLLFLITDGYTWGIHLDFDEYHFHSSGYESFPGDYKQVTESLEDALCWLIAFGDECEDRSQIEKLHIWPREVIKRVLADMGIDF